MTADSLPAGWTTAPVGELALLVQYGTSSKTNESGDGVPVLRMQNILNGAMSFDKLKFLPNTHPEFPALLLKPGDMLFNRTNSIELVGKTAVYHGEVAPCSFASYLIRLRPSLAYNSDLLAAYLNSPFGRSWIRSVANQQVGQANVNGSKLQALEVPVPPRAEQDRIVREIETQFSRLDAGVEALKRLQVHLKRYRSSLLKAACEGRLVLTEAELALKEGRDYEPADKLLARILKERRAKWEADQLAKMKAAGKTPKDDGWKARYEEPPALEVRSFRKLPEGWIWTTLAQLADLRGGITKGQKRSPGDRLRSISYLRVANVQRGYLDLTKMKEIEATEEEIAELQLRAGDMLFNEGGDRDKLGRGWVWRGEIEHCIHQNHVFRTRAFLPEIEPKFISWYGNSFGQRYFLEQGKQTTNLASINLTKLSAFPVPLPPVVEQQRIVSEVEDRLSLADAAENTLKTNLRRADRLRQSILKDAFEGRLVPQDPTDEPARALLERLLAERQQAGMAHPAKKKNGRSKSATAA